MSTEEPDSDISRFDPVVDDDAEKEGERHPDRGRAKAPCNVHAKDHPVEEVSKDGYN